MSSYTYTKKTADRIVDLVIHLALVLLALSMLYPFINIIAKSFSGYIPNTRGDVFLWPKEFQAQTFTRVVVSNRYLNSLGISVTISAMGTVFGVFVSALAAFVLSRKHFRGKAFFTVVFVFTMLFSAGIIPNYMLIKALKMDNTIWALVLPNVVSVYNMLILKSNFESLPDSLEESAKIDGACNFKVFFSILLPVSIPVVAAVSMFFAIGYWNDYFTAMLYITKSYLKPLQLYLYDIIKNAVDADAQQNTEAALFAKDSVEGITSSTILASILPILLVYPFAQKYFIKGVMIGSVKE